MKGRRLRAAVAVFVVFAAALAFTIPPFEAPDEPAHVAYVTFVGTRLALPNQGDPQATVHGQGHQAPLYYVLASGLVWLTTGDGRVEVRRGPNRAHVWHGGDRTDVPLYGGDERAVFPSARDRLAFYGLRLAAVALGAATVACVGLAAAVVVGAEAAAVAALLVATLPQFAAVAAAITADNLVGLFAALFAWQLLAGIVRGGDRRACTRAAVFLGLAMLTKKTALCLVPGVPVALAGGVLAGRLELRTACRLGARMLAIALVIVTPWLVRNQVLYGDPLGTAMERATLHALVHEKSLLDPWWWTNFAPWLASSFLGVLGWMNLWLPAPVYWAYAGLALLATAGLVLRAVRPRRQDVWLVVAAAFVLLCLAGIVHLNRTFSQPQGRYLFVVMPFLATLAAAGLVEIGRRVRLAPATLWWVLVPILLAIDVATLWRVARFFAPA